MAVHVIKQSRKVRKLYANGAVASRVAAESTIFSQHYVPESHMPDTGTIFAADGTSADQPPSQRTGGSGVGGRERHAENEVSAFEESPTEYAPHSRRSEGHDIFDHSNSGPVNSNGVLESINNSRGANAGVYSGVVVGTLLIALILRRQIGRSIETDDQSLLGRKVAKGMRAGRMEMEHGKVEPEDKTSDSDSDSFGGMA